MDLRGEPANSMQCTACGGRLHLLAEVPPRDATHRENAPRTAYFRCDRCAQIKIVER